MTFPQTKQELRHYYSMAAIALLVFTVLVEVAVQLYYIPYYLGNYRLFYSDWYYYAMDAIVIYPAGFIAFGLVLRNFPRPRLVKSPDPSAGQIFSGIAVGVGLLYLASIFTQMILADTDTVDYANEAISQEPLLVALLFTVVVAPIFEELLFRRLLLDRLLFLGDWSALLISSLFFGLFHTNLYQFFYATAVGLVLGYIHIMTGEMKWNIGLHMFINFFCGVLVDYLPDSDLVWGIFDAAIYLCIGYAIFYLLAKKPWRNLYPGPTSWSASEKRSACLTSIPFWLCVVAHLWLSVYYIYIA
ncbi:MAG: CPBP family intramembrane metalloprotease [Clostridiales bacterium]|nr:CPBP family intramembrane metalloprotease [Clostridiales bacterium]